MTRTDLQNIPTVEEDTDLIAIRSLLSEEIEPLRPARGPRHTEEEPRAGAGVASASTTSGDSDDDGLWRKVGDRPSVDDLPDAPTPGRRRSRTGRRSGRGVTAPLQTLATRLRGYRPTAKHLALASVSLLAVLKPWLVLGLLVLSLVGMFVLFVNLGSDRFWRGVLSLIEQVRRHSPRRAEMLRRRLDRFAMKWDVILDRFPEGWVDHLYMPDFGALAQADDLHDAAMTQRLARMHEDAAA